MKLWIKNIFAVAVSLSLVVAGLFLFHAPTWEWCTRLESKRILAAAQATNDLSAAVGTLGCFLTFTDHSWMAIRYRDSHGGKLASSAVVRDSDGAWFDSSEHFCGSFPAALHLVKKQQALRELGETNAPPQTASGRETTLISLMLATNLDAARNHLKALGFTNMSPP